jgi:hypothetical protein
MYNQRVSEGPLFDLEYHLTLLFVADLSTKAVDSLSGESY